jgi:hypothetical protein
VHEGHSVRISASSMVAVTAIFLRGPLSLVSTIEELIETRSSGSGLENRDYDLRDMPRSIRNSWH